MKQFEKGHKKLRAKMCECGLTSDKLSASIGMSRASLSSKLNGKSQFTVSEAQKIVGVLSIEPNEAFSYFFDD